jgi:hypothetical protein
METMAILLLDVYRSRKQRRSSVAEAAPNFDTSDSDE